MLLPSNNFVGGLPESELHDRLRLNKRVRFPSDGEMLPSRPMEASEMFVTSPFALEVMPSHMQQFVSLRHEVVYGIYPLMIVMPQEVANYMAGALSEFYFNAMKEATSRNLPLHEVVLPFTCKYKKEKIPSP
ncbi:hypothetical protein PR202_ga06496 [Eleusine coracana subsp. coracana]|uniref:Uncharacterized protein n=1 Tax=Eleusine coracana subsp. coracana TaxID=191504 RepID=A0AAV5BWW0_ELECO|nr:hypothetical protein PR202_ga06496 [Eleusine coracana subsp. coracana]